MNWNRPRLSPRTKIGAGAFVLLAVGAAGGAGAMSLTRPAVEMAPVVPVAIARLPQADGVVTVRGRIAQVYGDHFVLNDGTGNALVDTGRTTDNAVQAGRTMTVQGHYNNGTLRASYLVNPQGQIAQAARRVSLVTAVSPRALVDVVFVLVACARLLRSIAGIYAGRPGTLGLIRLARQVLNHLVLTGGIAAGDAVIQQVVGQGLAARLSAKLGEGVINGMLTARIGLAALEKLKEAGSAIHSRKLRSFDEPPFR